MTVVLYNPDGSVDKFIHGVQHISYDDSHWTFKVSNGWQKEYRRAGTWFKVEA